MQNGFTIATGRFGVESIYKFTKYSPNKRGLNECHRLFRDYVIFLLSISILCMCVLRLNSLILYSDGTGTNAECLRICRTPHNAYERFQNCRTGWPLRGISLSVTALCIVSTHMNNMNKSVNRRSRSTFTCLTLSLSSVITYNWNWFIWVQHGTIFVWICNLKKKAISVRCRLISALRARFFCTRIPTGIR